MAHFVRPRAPPEVGGDPLRSLGGSFELIWGALELIWSPGGGTWAHLGGLVAHLGDPGANQKCNEKLVVFLRGKYTSPPGALEILYILQARRRIIKIPHVFLGPADGAGAVKGNF